MGWLQGHTKAEEKGRRETLEGKRVRKTMKNRLQRLSSSGIISGQEKRSQVRQFTFSIPHMPETAVVLSRP